MAAGPSGGSGQRRLRGSPEEILAGLRVRSEVGVRQRWRRVRASSVLAFQAGVAAALSWLFANNVLHHPQPVFAPISAVIVLDISSGQRLRRTAELVFGVALGIFIGDTIVFGIGTGAWQLGLVVFLATILSVFIGGTPAVVSNAASSGVLIATLSPPQKGVYYLRFEDALIGGLIALGVMALLLPANPVAAVARKAGPACTVLSDGLAQAAHAMSTRNADEADEALTHLQQAGLTVSQFRDALPESRETARVAPLRWRTRSALGKYRNAAEYLERALSNTRVLARRVVTMIRDEEPIPEHLYQSVYTLAEATKEVRKSLLSSRPDSKVADLSAQAVGEAAEAYRNGLSFSGSAVVAQIRAIATDLLGTADLPHGEANELVRRAGGNPAKP
ncbi:aromatic acid exporter family protein [Rugosimonospora acidiphila]|uniref:Aromatic acid exporter family protein n=1 Tax=Rugosimonospora acidiphila TaxID=556531 RepID=A0ABP9SLE0_9ACTN